MKLLEIIIKPYKLEDVKDALQDAGIMTGMTILEVRGFGRQQGHTELYRGGEYQMDFLPKIAIEILADDADVKKICDVVQLAARTGKIGDGKIFVHNLEHVQRIRTDESGADAI